MINTSIISNNIITINSKNSKNIDEENEKNKDKLFLINFIESNNKIKKIKLYLINKSNLYKFKILNKLLSICIHILVMVIFEIYFYFDYVVKIENEKFINKIDNYFKKSEMININEMESLLIREVVLDNREKFTNKLYSNYIESKKIQKEILHKLFIKSCKMSGGLGVIFFILLIISLFNHKHIEWNTIFIENLMMFLFLGLFEYYFFTNVILQYEPVTNEEIQYKIVNGSINYMQRLELFNNQK